MPDTRRMLSLASAAALTLALGQTVAAEQATTAAAGAAPVPPAPPAALPAPPAGPEAARAEAEARMAEMDAERNKRYEELRARAKEVGMDLPETPPWADTTMGQMPAPPAMPEGWGPKAEEWQAMMKEREAMREKIRNMTPEERAAMREEHWKKMRERAAERGVQLPETPPWKEAEERYKAAKEQFEKYRKIVDEMTPEQQEAARALFGGGPGARGPRPWGPGARGPAGPFGYGPRGGYPDYGPGPYGPGAIPAPPSEGGEPAPADAKGPAPY